MKLTYVVVIEVSDDFPAKVVDNYIPRALKRYAEHDEQKAFKEVGSPNVSIMERMTEQEIKDFLNYIEVVHRMRKANGKEENKE